MYCGQKVSCYSYFLSNRVGLVVFSVASTESNIESTFINTDLAKQVRMRMRSSQFY